MKTLQHQLHSSRGFILAEACVSLALIGLVLGVASLLLTQHVRATEYFLNYRRGQLAAESCVERMRIGALEVVDASFTDDTGILYEIRVIGADGAWQPLRRVNVLAIVGEKNGRTAQYSLNAYVDATVGSRGKGP